MAKNVYQCIAEVQSKLAKEGISKDRRNQQQGYQFRGIDDVYNALASILADVGLVILPTYTTREITERASAKGGLLFSVVVRGEFTLVSSHDGSTATVVTYGEAMDSADKATNKAMSAAYKYMALQVFAIPTEGDNDADATTHNVRGTAPIKTQITPTAGLLEALPDNIQQELRDWAAEIQEAYDKAGAGPASEIWEDAIFDNEHKAAAWSLLDSKCRAAIKKHKAEKATA